MSSNNINEKYKEIISNKFTSLNYNVDIENQNILIEEDNFYIEDIIDDNNNFFHNTNSHLEKFKSANTLFYSNQDSKNNFRKSNSYPNNLKKIINQNINQIEMICTTNNPIINYNNYNESELMILPNKFIDNSDYFSKIYYFFELDKISVRVNILNKFISLILHIFTMVIFEIYFYFNYVVKIEKKQFMNKIKQYTNEFTENLNLDQTQREIIKQLYVYKYDSSFLSELYILYKNSIKEQNKLLYQLLKKSCSMAGIIGLILIGLIIIGFWKKYIIKWKWIWIENFIMFILLGLFEYWFFINVILKYNPITDAEIKYFVVNKFLNFYNSTI